MDAKENGLPEAQMAFDFPETSEGVRRTREVDVEENRVETVGAGALSDVELVSLMVGAGERVGEEGTIAERLLAEAGSIHRLVSWTAADFRRLKGIGQGRAGLLVAAFELARRALCRPVEEKPLMKSAEAVASYLKPYAAGLEVEKLWALCLNRKNRLIKCVEISSGTATNAPAHPREFFRAIIQMDACGAMAAHNHVSGDPSPSSADIEVTRVLRSAAKAVDIDFFDHVVVGRVTADPLAKGWYSFRDAGMI